MQHPVLLWKLGSLLFSGYPELVPGARVKEMCGVELYSHSPVFLHGLVLN
jgi:hypothetical protein